MTKHSWTTPELVVIVRSKPEEAVLVGCKDTSGNSPGGGPNPNITGPCYQSSTAGGQESSNAWCKLETQT